MKTKLILLALLIASPAFAQTQPTVRQTGSITAGHIATWSANQVIQDGGAAPSSTISLGTSVSATNPRISGDATTGLYTAGAGLVDVSISGIKGVEWSSVGEALAGTFTGTSASSNCLTVGRQGSTSPALQVDCSAATAVNGIKLTSAASGSRPSITSIGSNSTLLIGTNGTGSIHIGSNNNTGAGIVNVMAGSTGTEVNINPNAISFTAQPPIQIGGAANTSMTASTEVPMMYINLAAGSIQHATGALAVQRDLKIDCQADSFVGASVLTNAACLGVGYKSAGTNATVTNTSALYIPTQALSGTITNSYAINAVAATGPTNNYAAIFMGGNVGIGSATPRASLDQSQQTGAEILPIGTTGQRPTGISGMLRYNSTTPDFEGYLSTRWASFDMTPEVSGYMYNPSNNQFPKLAAAVNKVKANGGNSNWLMLGSSTIAGYCSAWGSWQQPLTMEYLMAQYLQAYGLTTAQANNDSIFGYPVTDGTGRVTADSRLTVGAGWGASATISAGGPMYVNTTTTASGTTNSISISIPATADKVVIITPQDTTLGTISYRVNAGSATNIVEAGAAAAIQTTVTLAPGAGNKLNIDRVSGTANLIGVYFYLSTTSSVNIFNMGVGLVTAGGYLDGSGKPYASPAIYSALSPDFSFIMMMSNDAIANTASATYKANIQSLYNQLTNGDVLLGTQIAYGSGAGTVANIAPKIVDLQTLATTNNTAFFNNYARWGGDAGYTNLGNSNMNCDDGLHGNMFGYQAVAWDTLSQAMLVAGFASPPANQFLSLNGGGPAGTAIVYHPTPQSIGIGNDALFTSGLAANTGTEGNNIGIGDYALSGAVPGSGAIRNTIVGYQAGQYITTGDRNTALGTFALNGNSVSVTGSNNVAIGLSTGQTVATGSANTLIGNHVASTTLQTGSNNILIGVDSTTDTAAAATSNTYLVKGTGAAVISTTGTNTTAPLSTLGGPQISAGTKFTITGCSAGTTVGGAAAGRFVSGTTGTCTVVITIAGATGAIAPTGWSCWANDLTTSANLINQTTSSTTTATLAGTTVSGDVINFGCMGF